MAIHMNFKVEWGQVCMINLLFNVLKDVFYGVLLLAGLPSLKNALRDIEKTCLIAFFR